MVGHFPSWGEVGVVQIPDDVGQRLGDHVRTGEPIADVVVHVQRRAGELPVKLPAEPARRRAASGGLQHPVVELNDQLLIGQWPFRDHVAVHELTCFNSTHCLLRYSLVSCLPEHSNMLRM
ncbi:hypothetical protein D3C73_1287790 [compost metagenome]